MGTFQSTNERNKPQINETISNPEESIIINKIESGEIPKPDALKYMSNYGLNGNPLGIKNSTGQEVNGFYFDAKHVKDLVRNLHDDHDRVYIALAKASPNSSNKTDYTLVLTAVRPTIINSEIKFKYLHDVDHIPWIEFAKPCPDQCPIDL